MPQSQYCGPSHQRVVPGSQLSAVQTQNAVSWHCGSSQSVSPLQSLSMPSPQNSQSSCFTHFWQFGAEAQSGSSQSILPSQSLSFPSSQISGLGSQIGPQSVTAPTHVPHFGNSGSSALQVCTPSLHWPTWRIFGSPGQQACVVPA